MKRIPARILLMAGLILLLSGVAFGQRGIRTSNMIPNNDTEAGMRALIQILADAEITVAPLGEVLNGNFFHQEGPEASGLALSSEAVTFLPSRRGPLRGEIRNFTLVVIDDQFTHIVLNAETITDLRNRDFLETPQHRFLWRVSKGAPSIST